MKLPDIAIQTVSLIAGTGTAYGAGDPDAGQAIANFLKSNLHSLFSELSSQRQATRVKDVSQYALNGIKHRLENDEKLRDDGFFERTIDRSNAEESFEAVLLKAQDEFEEKKIPYLGKLFENACFDSQIHAGLLHILCKDFESLTYRQLCIIKMIIENKHPLSLKSTVETPWLTADRMPLLSEDAFPTLVECVSLGHRGYIDFKLSPPDDTRSGPVALLVPNSMRTRVPAGQMYGRMGLASIPESDVIPIAKSLAATKVQS